MKWFVLALCFACAAVSLGARGRCKSADDCEEGECCVTYAIVSFFGGVCRSLRKEGESCTPIVKKDQEEEPDMHLFQCPCVEGLECVATHELTIFGRVIKHKPECVVPGKEDLSTAQPPEPETKEPEPEPETKEPEPEPETAEPDPEPEAEEGPGGERPRDDDCEDWTYGC